MRQDVVKTAIPRCIFAICVSRLNKSILAWPDFNLCSLLKDKCHFHGGSAAVQCFYALSHWLYWCLVWGAGVGGPCLSERSEWLLWPDQSLEIPCTSVGNKHLRSGKSMYWFGDDHVTTVFKTRGGRRRISWAITVASLSWGRPKARQIKGCKHDKCLFYTGQQLMFTFIREIL